MQSAFSKKKNVLFTALITCLLFIISSVFFMVWLDPVSALAAEDGEQTFNVSFYDGTSKFRPDITVTKGEKAAKPATDPVLSGHNFKGWVLKSQNIIWDFDVNFVEKNISLYALFEIQTPPSTTKTGTFSIQVFTMNSRNSFNVDVEYGKVIDLGAHASVAISGREHQGWYYVDKTNEKLKYWDIESDKVTENFQRLFSLWSGGNGTFDPNFSTGGGINPYLLAAIGAGVGAVLVALFGITRSLVLRKKAKKVVIIS
jgi:uncharacterized integral membrane protein